MYELATIVVHSAGNPWWYYLVFIVGAGGLGGILYGGYKAIRNIAEILTVLQGTRGGKGVRAIKPLVEIVDGLVVETSSIKAEITPNGGLTNSLGDRVIRTEESLSEHRDELASRDEAVRRSLEEHQAETTASDENLRQSLEEHILDDATVQAALQQGIDDIRVPGLKERFSNLVDEVRRIGTVVGQVHAEIRTINGKSIAELADETEGRRIRDDVSKDQRTPAERHYVQHVEEAEAQSHDAPK